jgi:hypothetical protein
LRPGIQAAAPPGQGLGRALRNGGARVQIVDRDEAELGAVANSIGGDAIAAQWARERSNVIGSDAESYGES